jgi:hypothetical protein
VGSSFACSEGKDETVKNYQQEKRRMENILNPSLLEKRSLHPFHGAKKSTPSASMLELRTLLGESTWF